MFVRPCQPLFANLFGISAKNFAPVLHRGRNSIRLPQVVAGIDAGAVDAHLEMAVDLDYKNAFDKAYQFNIDLNKLPNVNGIDLSNAEDIDKLEKTYNEMTDYEKSFVASDNVKKLNQYIERLKEVRAAAGETEGNGDGEGGDGEDGDAEKPGTEEVEGA